MANYKSHLGINVNLPEITIWRIRLKLSVFISVTTAVAPNDGVLATVFVDGQNQTVLNQLSNSFDERDLLYDMLYATETLKYSTDSAAANLFPVLYKEYDIKAHRSLRSVDDTLFLQLASSGTAHITGYSLSMATLIKVG